MDHSSAHAVTSRRLEGVTEAADYLAAYDAQLRTDAETPGALRIERLGPLSLVTFARGRGFVTYRDLGGVDADTIESWVGQVLDHYVRDPAISRVEWKTRGHDHAPGLHESLILSGFEPEETESIMIGRADLLDVDVPLPEAVTLRRVSDAADVRAMSAMQGVVFGDDPSEDASDALLQRLALADGMELWVAEVGGEVVGAGRLEPVDGTDFAGVWGGAVLPDWRRRGIYRALTAVRVRSALAQGKTLVHSDSTEWSRPILERSGLVAVSTTTPYRWRRER